MRILRCLFVAILINTSAYAWNTSGHMLAAEIAFQSLDDEQQERMQELSSTFKDLVPYATTYHTCSVWPDTLRDTMNLFSRWHYTNTPYDPDGVLTPHRLEVIRALFEGNDVVWVIKEASKTLQNEGANALERGLTFHLLMHCVADAHQPLHTTTRYSHEHPEGDMGGNKFKIEGMDAPNLHWLWDSGMETFPHVENEPSDDDLQVIKQYAQDLMIKYPPSYFANLYDADPEHWAAEGHLIAATFAYQCVEGQRPSQEYLDVARIICEERIVLSGYRLAEILKKSL